MNKQADFQRGLMAGIPIGLGYLSVSFTFGILAVMYGLTWWQALLISMLTVTSAGQFAGIDQMRIPGMYLPMFLSQITINIRYSFMSISLSQKVSRYFTPFWRFVFSFFVTDEIFAVATKEKEVSRSFFAGLILLPYLGWSLGTLFGALLGNILPQFLLSAFGVALYGMFIAIVVPDMKGNKAITIVVFVAILFSCLFYYVPFLKKIPSGITISICAISAAALGAFLFPVPGERSGDESKAEKQYEGTEEKEVTGV